MTTYLKLAFLLVLIPSVVGASSAATPSSYFPWEWQPVNMAVAGVSGSAVTSVVVDDEGSVWVGTHSGLAVFSRHEWKLFQAETSSLPDNDVAQLLKTSAGEICVRTGEAIAIIRDSKWATVDVHRLGTPRTMTLASDGTLWAIGQMRGDSKQYTLAHFKGGGWSYFNIKYPEARTDPSVTSLLVQSEDMVWTGTVYGIFRLDSSGFAHRVPELTALDKSDIHSLGLDSRGAIWIGSSHSETEQLCSYSAGKLRVFDTTNSALPSGEVSALVADYDGSIWALITKARVFTGMSLLNAFSGTNGIVHIVDDDKWEVATPQNSSLADQAINAIASTPSGLWLGTNVGLIRGQRSRWSVFDIGQRADVGEELLDIKVAEDGSVWCLTNFALRVLPLSGKPITSLVVPNTGEFGGAAMAISPDKRLLWVLFGGSLYRIDSRNPTAPKEVPIKVDDGDHKQGIVVNKNGDLVFGESAQLSKLTFIEGQPEPHVEPFTLKAPSLESTGNTLDTFLDGGPVKLIVRDSRSGTLAIAGIDGFDVCRGVDCVHYGKEKLKLPDVNTHSLVFAQDGTLWAALGSDLIHILNGDQIRRYKASHINVVAIAGDQSLWIGSTNGLSHFKEDENSWEVYDGGNSKLPGDIQTIDFASDGSLWVGGRQNGVAHYRPLNTQPEVLSLANAVSRVTEREHTFGIIPFDPAFETKLESFRYHWTIKHLLTGKTVADQYASTPFQTFKLDDGYYNLNVVAIDRYGIESKPFPYSFQVAVPSDNPWIAGMKKSPDFQRSPLLV